MEGRILVTAQDGGLMLQTRDGTIWPVQPGEILSKTSDSTAFTPYTADELSGRKQTKQQARKPGGINGTDGDKRHEN